MPFPRNALCGAYIPEVLLEVFSQGARGHAVATKCVAHDYQVRMLMLRCLSQRADLVPPSKINLHMLFALLSVRPLSQFDHCKGDTNCFGRQRPLCQSKGDYRRGLHKEEGGTQDG
eukprot:1161149-Pelagomonas_calceolata.AAC.5